MLKWVRRYRTQVTLALMAVSVLVMGLSGTLLYRFVWTEQMNQIRYRLIAIAQTAVLAVDSEDVKSIPADRSALKTEAYQKVLKRLEQIKQASPFLAYIYILAPTQEAGRLRFVSDPTPRLQSKGLEGPTALPGDLYDASRFPEMMAAFTGATADHEISEDEWGMTLSGYAPIRDSNGEAIAILGVDMFVKDIEAARRSVQRRMALIFLIGLFAAMALGVPISRSLTGRLSRITEGTRHLAKDDFDWRVEVGGQDEISNLADSFNRMASDLAVSREKLKDYFHRVIEVLVRMLEARDPYTRGHSERVAGYAEAIGQQMGFAAKEVALLKKAALLHDVGKLVIFEKILNKPGALSEEEWEKMREHPATGEAILKPAFDEDSFLKMVRSHHERYDGTGYPDKTSGEVTSLFAQIISVADSYDAMTTSRAYRPALSREQAVGELTRNAGSQFHPSVVSAFLAVLKD